MVVTPPDMPKNDLADLEAKSTTGSEAEDAESEDTLDFDCLCSLRSDGGVTECWYCGSDVPCTGKPKSRY
ncbi:MAG: uncharacterized protein KVP18_002782 [Porospora cf. gigantea A]|uniref:uncharacterized protein n=1 Tax=Porospora cf. gigantea A TaxID=2853593 RepID=UPI00355A3098|nr:MAG: hypothetical protein KVP18_002782 [Porospora cf. gigantea A]